MAEVVAGVSLGSSFFSFLPRPKNFLAPLTILASPLGSFFLASAAFLASSALRASSALFLSSAKRASSAFLAFSNSFLPSLEFGSTALSSGAFWNCIILSKVELYREREAAETDGEARAFGMLQRAAAASFTEDDKARGNLLASGTGGDISGGSIEKRLGRGTGGRMAGDIMENQLSARLRSVTRSRLALPANC